MNGPFDQSRWANGPFTPNHVPHRALGAPQNRVNGPFDQSRWANGPFTPNHVPHRALGAPQNRVNGPFVQTRWANGPFTAVGVSGGMGIRRLAGRWGGSAS
ncbi:hypothetical protein GCM10027271_20980 [Saccharopolyspora gloriosae]